MEEKRKKPRRKQAYTVLMLLCIIIFLFALYKVISIVLDYKEIDDYYKKANDDFITMQDDGQLAAIDFNRLRGINEDVSGWIYIKDTDISYPVLQGPTNDYYLFRNYEKEYLVAGSIFLEATNKNDFSDDHTVVYGHNMHNGSMFGSLDKFMKEDYRDEHPYIHILLPDGTWNKYEIFGSYIADIDDGTFTVFNDNSQEYDKYLKLIQEKNQYSNTEYPEEGEKILTLSTCTEDSDDYRRYVLQAKYVGTVDKIE